MVFFHGDSCDCSLSVGPLALPLVWFNPRYKPITKLVLTAVLFRLVFCLYCFRTSVPAIDGTDEGSGPHLTGNKDWDQVYFVGIIIKEIEMRKPSRVTSSRAVAQNSLVKRLGF